MAPRVSQLVIYPVKSLAGHSVDAAELTDTGFRHDRAWMVVDEAGAFLTQRQHPAMARVKAVASDASLRLTVPGHRPLDVPILEAGKNRSVQVWANECAGIDQGDAAAELLGSYLGRSCRLVRMAPAFRRPISTKYQVTGDEIVGFADSMPILMTCSASLDDLNTRLESPVPMNRFRPNIVIEGGDPFQEDGWARLRIGSATFRVAKDCYRCQIITIDQETGVKGIEPLETLGTYHVGTKGVRFGRYLVHEARTIIKAGDPVEVLA